MEKCGKKKKAKAWLVGTLISFAAITVMAGYQTKVYMEQGGDEQVVASGGKITVQSGGTLSLEAGSVYSCSTGSYLSTAGLTATYGVVGGTLAISGSSNLASTLNVDGAVTLNSTLDVDGNIVAGASNYRSTFTASTGALALTGALSSQAGLSGTTVNTGQGANELYAMDQSVQTSNSVSFATATITGGPLRIYSRSQAQILAKTPAAVGDLYYCSDCTTTAVCVSTGTTLGSFGIISNLSALCD